MHRNNGVRTFLDQARIGLLKCCRRRLRSTGQRGTGLQFLIESGRIKLQGVKKRLLPEENGERDYCDVEFLRFCQRDIGSAISDYTNNHRSLQAMLQTFYAEHYSTA